VAITAGASAPEELVQECVAYLRTSHAAVVEERTIREEDMHFQLPVALRRAMTRSELASAAGS
jgi:4-hydroxy-3-methylbut-2-enyl diphosphate reductase